MEIGDSVWFYGDERRFANPEHKIIGETSRSWLVGCDCDAYKVPKKTESNAQKLGNYRVIKVSDRGYTHAQVFLSKESYDNAVWVEKNRYPIAEAVKQAEPNVLRQIAALIGYKERP